MKYQFVKSIVVYLFALYALVLLTSCAAPVLLSEDDAISDYASQFAEPLIRVGDDDSFQPALAESWSITKTSDVLQATFRLRSNLNENSINIRDIPLALEQANNLPCTDCTGIHGGNPCIYSTPIPPFPTGPFSVAPIFGNDQVVSITISPENCGSEDPFCENSLMQSIADFPLFNPNELRFNSLTNVGTYIFEHTSSDGSQRMLEYNPKDGDVDICTECEPEGPSPIPTCEPTFP